MKRSSSTALTALLLAGAMLLSACGSTEETTSTATDATSADTSVSTEAPVQELRTSMAGAFATLDPALISTTVMGDVAANVSAGLFRTLADGKMENVLCDTYTVSEDALTYTFTIKDGVLWSDGEPLTSEHFVYGLKRAIGYGPTNAYTVRNLTTFVVGAEDASNNELNVADMTDVGVTAIDDLTFEVQLLSPCPYFLKLFTGTVTHPVRADFAPEHESAWSISTSYPTVGAFQIESIVAEEGAVVVKNPNYVNADLVSLEKITFTVMPDSSAQLNAFKAGELDIALSVPTDIATNSNYDTTRYKSSKYCSSHFTLLNAGPKNTMTELLDPTIRQALAMSIDKNVMVTMLGSGDYVTPLDGFIPYGFEGLEDDFRAEKSYLEYDLEAAKALMEAAGYSESNPLKFEYLYSNSTFNADVAQMLQQFWAQIYVEAELRSVEGSVFYDFVDNGDFVTSRYGNSDSTDPLNYFKIFTSDAQIEGCQAISDPVYDQMVADAYLETDPVKYIEKLHEIEDYFVGEMAYVLPLFTQESVILVQENVEGFWTNPGGTTIYETVEIK